MGRSRRARRVRRRGRHAFPRTLVWYKHRPPAFLQLDGAGPAFAKAYDDYIGAVVGRYRGRLSSCDTLNEPVTHKGDGLRASLWSANLGEEGHMLRAFERAREADPDMIQFINEYDLEVRPQKRLTFMRLVERLLKRGVPIGGIGTQTHIKADLPDGAMNAAIRDLATFGLPIHISELDISFGRRSFQWRPLAWRRQQRLRKVGEVVNAYMALPERQRYALTWWGFSDRDTWLRRPPMDVAGGKDDEPLAFDEAGEPKPLFWTMAERLKANCAFATPQPGR